MGKKTNTGVAKKSSPVDTMSSAAGPVQPSSPGGPRPLDDWDHKNNADKLMEAHEIMGDPAKMKGAMMHIKKKAKAIRSVKDLQDFHQEKYGPGGDPDLAVEGKNEPAS